MNASTERKTSPLGERIRTALDAEGRSQTATEDVLVERGVLSKGQLSSLISGRRGTRFVDVEVLGAIADFLHVDFDWLARGRGGMRRGGRETTPAEEALVFARRNGAREDAITSAWERHKDRADAMSATDWILAIDHEARLLERSGVSRPEEVRTAKKKIATVKKQIDKARKDAVSKPAADGSRVRTGAA